MYNNCQFFLPALPALQGLVLQYWICNGHLSFVKVNFSTFGFVFFPPSLEIYRLPELSNAIPSGWLNNECESRCTACTCQFWSATTSILFTEDRIYHSPVSGCRASADGRNGVVFFVSGNADSGNVQLNLLPGRIFPDASR